jgi:quercetin dioxygenase-like cupin family protein
MITATLGDHPMNELWLESDPERKFLAGWSLYWNTGNQDSCALLTFMEPDGKIPMHSDSAEEIILVLEGEIEAWLEGEEPVRLTPGMMAVMPALVVHGMHNVGTTRSKVVGFMAANTILTHFPDGKMLPPNTPYLGTPPPEMPGG